MSISVQKAKKYLSKKFTNEQVQAEINLLQPLVQLCVTTAIYKKRISKNKTYEYYNNDNETT